MIYITSDVHSRWSYLEKLLEYINFSNQDKLIINGDLFDRGVDLDGLLDFIYSNENVDVILGNHELMFMNTYTTGQIRAECINNYIDYSYGEVDELLIGDRLVRWIENGGLATYRELMKRSRETGEDEIKKLYNYLQGKSYYLVEDNCVITHCGPSINLDIYTVDSIIEDLKSKEIHDVVWNRLFHQNYIKEPRMRSSILSCNIIIGHTVVDHINNKFFRIIEGNFILNTNINSFDALSLFNLNNKSFYSYYHARNMIEVIQLNK